MKFEKFLKQVGTHGEVVQRNESEKWLICGGVGMIIPCGVDNLLGTGKGGKYTSIIEVISNAELDDPLDLKKAVLLEPTGNASSIYRVFETQLGDTVGIINAAYGLLEKNDLLGYCELDVDDKEAEDGVRTIKYILVYDRGGNLQGFITGSQKF